MTAIGKPTYPAAPGHFPHPYATMPIWSSRPPGVPPSSDSFSLVRIALPALTNNLVSLAKTTSLAYVIAVPEMTYVLNQVWSDNVNVPEMMLLLFLFYIIVVTALAGVLHFIERKVALPGYGQ